MSGFFGDDEKSPSVFIQYKNTDICMDFYCECGAHGHFDGYFAYTVKCPHCSSIWEMPPMLYPRRADEKTDSYWKDNAQLLEPDEDHSDEFVDADGVTKLKARPVSK